MKTKLTVLFYLLFAATVYGQEDKFPCKGTSLDTPEEVKKAESCVLTAADYVLTRPLTGNPPMYKTCQAFLITWMEKTPDFSFNIKSEIASLSKDKEESQLLFGVYIACVSKAAVELRKNFEPAAVKALAVYIKNPDHKIKQSSKIKKFLEDCDKNDIDKYYK
jgi:hypothetical protein